MTKSSRTLGRNRRRPLRKVILPAVVLITIVSAGVACLGSKATTIRSELEAAEVLIPQLKQAILDSDEELARDTVAGLRAHTSAARRAADDPIWTFASGLPWLGSNASAVAEMAKSADDVVSLGLVPLMKVYESLNWDALLPSGSTTNLAPLKAAAPSVASAAYAVHASSDRLERIDKSRLLPQVADPLVAANEELKQAVGALDSAADAATIAPDMLGADGAKHYLLMVQNNAEARATGGIPGALAVLTVDKGKLSLGVQSSATEMGVFVPNLDTDPQQQDIYTSRLGKYMQDVNLTPDFPTAASTAQSMWEKKFGQKVDGVVSIDPVVLSYILEATGPIPLTGAESSTMNTAGLPSELTSTNVVPTLLSDVYAKLEQPKLQDAYFAGVAKDVFTALAEGKGDAKGLISGFTQGAEEGRVLLWSGDPGEQGVIAKYPLSGSIAGPSISPAQFGVYFNDGTGAKMDYYVERTVQLVKECPADGYEQTTVRVTTMNTAPPDAASSLPSYVTGGGAYGVPAGSVRTNIVAYGPVQANVESAKVDGKKTAFAPYLHGSRPVGVLSQQLAPGEKRTVEVTFGKIVQHTEPDLFVTPMLQPVKDVILPAEVAPCD